MNLLSFVKVFFSILILLLFPFGLLNYEGNVLYYIVFTILSSYTLLTTFDKKSISFDTFFSLLFWLGFWFKFTVQISLLNSQFPEGVGMFNFSAYSYDQIIIISSVSLIAFLFYRFLRVRFIFNYANYNSQNFDFNRLLNFYEKFRFKILIIYILTIIIVPSLNYFFIFFQKGTIPETVLPFGFNNIINWLLMFGIASFSSLFIFLEFHLKKKNSNKVIKLSIIENFFSSISILSRAMIFNSTAILYGFYRMLESEKVKISASKFFKYFFIIIFFFSVSLIVVSKIRQSKNFPIGHEVHNYIPNIGIDSKKNNNVYKIINDFSKEFNQIIFLISGRWVGIEGVMSVYGNEDINMDSFWLSFNDKFDYSNSFYENIVKKSNHIYKKEPKIFTVYVPGIVGYLYYTKSLTFLFFGIFSLCVICSIFEFIAFKISKGNFIFSYLIGNVLAYRLIHFGYLPQNTYKLIIAIIFTFILLTVIFKLVERIKL